MCLLSVWYWYINSCRDITHTSRRATLLGTMGTDGSGREERIEGNKVNVQESIWKCPSVLLCYIVFYFESGSFTFIINWTQLSILWDHRMAFSAHVYSYLSCCWRKYQIKAIEKRVNCDSQFQDPVHPGEVIMAAGAGGHWTCCIYCQKAERTLKKVPSQSGSSFPSVG